MTDAQRLRVIWRTSLILVMILYYSFAHAKVIRVDIGGQEDFNDIQTGIDAAVNGDTIIVSPGQYIITVPMTFQGKLITVRSKSGSEQTTIRMSDSPDDTDRASVIVFENGETDRSVLDGFTITGGQGCWSDSFAGVFCQSGGGIFCSNSSPTITNCIISGNHTLSEDQTQTVAGGVFLVNSSSIMTRCTINNNSTTYWAGGMYIANGSPIITDCVISENSVLHDDGQGGGLIINGYGSSCTAVLLRCTISGNSAPHSAGGIQVSSDAEPTFRNCMISDNMTQGGIGGILCSYGSLTTLTNCTIARNSCVRIVGGIASGHNGKAIVTNCTITGNVAGRHSGGITSYDNSSILINNCIIYGNSAPSGSEIGLDYGYYKTPTNMNISYSDIKGGLSAAHIGQGTTLTWENGNIDTDPLFADPNKGDFHLKSQEGHWDSVLFSENWIIDDVSSPCIDAGDPNSPVANELFPNGGRINMGAYGGTVEASKSPSGFHAKYSGGTGEPNDPYQIATAEDLMLLGESPEDYGKHFILTADIDLDPNLPGRKVFNRAVIAPDINDAMGDWGWSDFDGVPFTGVFDGNGYALNKLQIRGSDYLGLFGILGSGAKITDLGLEAVDINGTGAYVGSLAGINGDWNEGAGIVIQCYSTGMVNGDLCVGGLVGEIVGSAKVFGVLSNCYSTCTVSGSSSVGGLAGECTWRGRVSDCHSTGKITATGAVGGLVGSNEGSITASYSTGTVDGIGFTSGVGGLIGKNGGSVTTSHSSADINGLWSVGGLVGRNYIPYYMYTYHGSIAMSYSTGTVSGNGSVGGLVGSIGEYDIITMSYSTGMVTGAYQTGGLVGFNERGADSIIISSVWDVETSGQATSAGGTGLTTAEMQDITTYLNAGWDFVGEVHNGTWDCWEISLGDYPQLRYLGGDSPMMPEGLGTPEQPYLIRDARDLGTVWFEPTGHYRLESSVDLSGIKWSTAVVPWFEGNFDGNGHVINNLHIQGDGNLGLFGQLTSGAKISNLGLEAVDVNGIRHSVGGLVGDIDDGSVSNCFSTGTVIGGSQVGGLIGANSGSVTTSYSTAAVAGDRRIGGFVGWNGASISMSYSTGVVTGNSVVGGLVATNYSDGSIISSFWDVETSGLSTSTGGTGKTTAEMQTAKTFLDAGWDFADEASNGTRDIWWIDEGNDYPRLWWELIPEN